MSGEARIAAWKPEVKAQSLRFPSWLRKLLLVVATLAALAGHLAEGGVVGVAIQAAAGTPAQVGMVDPVEGLKTELHLLDFRQEELLGEA